jgi:hypothetical protein
MPTFVDPGSGGWFKGRDPNVRAEVLEAKWVRGASILYVGKASSLESRLRQLVAFGTGKPVGHFGGRYLWQLADAMDLEIHWSECQRPIRARESMAGCLP